jgi:hypothetical protein
MESTIIVWNVTDGNTLETRGKKIPSSLPPQKGENWMVN